MLCKKKKKKGEEAALCQFGNCLLVNTCLVFFLVSCVGNEQKCFLVRSTKCLCRPYEGRIKVFNNCPDGNWEPCIFFLVGSHERQALSAFEQVNWTHRALLHDLCLFTTDQGGDYRLIRPFSMCSYRDCIPFVLKFLFLNEAGRPRC